MRSIWIDKDTSPYTTKLQVLGITRVYFDARSTPQASPEKNGVPLFERGIYRVQAWDNLGPPAFAKTLSDDVARWGGDPRKQLAVHANIELHDPAYLVAFLKAWRALRPRRETALVIEGGQGGWFSNALRAEIAAAKVDVIAEAYAGDMTPFDADNTRSNLIDYGVLRQHALVFYDAKHLPPYWDGCAFGQQRLP